MKKLSRILLLLIVGFTLSIHLFASETIYPFEVKISGKGKQAIILIPGFASSGKVWDETKVLFEKNYTCYTLTMAGFAGEAPVKNSTFKSWENGIAAYIEDENLGKTIIIGHSMGGGLALALAADYPELIAKIIVVDALPCLAALSNPTFISKEVNDCSEMVNKFATIKESDFYTMQKSSIRQLMEDTIHQKMVIDWSMKTDRTTFAEMYCDFINIDLRENIKTITCPSLILLESYFINSKPAIEQQYKNLKTGNLHYATQGLHFIMYDDPNWYNKQITDFIN